MVTTREALELVLRRVAPLPAVELSLHEALGQVLAEEVRALEELPAFASSAMDGFAVRAADVAGAGPERPARLLLLEDLPAGTVARRPVAAGCASRIMTGAPVPEGADTVVPVEQARAEGPHVAVLRPVPWGGHVRRAGEDLGLGEVAVAAGSVLRPPELALLAAVGRVRVRVVRRPVVAVLTTGAELVDAADQPGPGQIRDCNVHGLAGDVRAAGAVAWPLPRVRDTVEAVTSALHRAVAAADLVVTSGGVSVGDFDFVKTALHRMGAEEVFWQVAQKPGKPMGVWALEDKVVIGLPGNPVSALLCFEVYVRPALRRMMGHALLHRPVVGARLLDGYRKAQGDRRVHWLRVRLAAEGGRRVARLTGAQGSGVLSTLARANALVEVPAGSRGVAPGGRVLAHRLDRPEER